MDQKEMHEFLDTIVKPFIGLSNACLKTVMISTVLEKDKLEEALGCVERTAQSMNEVAKTISEAGLDEKLNIDDLRQVVDTVAYMTKCILTDQIAKK